MDAAKIFEGIALLIELAQKGEIDPWDVQVIEVIDRYLSEIVSGQEMVRSSYEADLSQSGQAFLLVSLLVLFKANTLIELESANNEQELSGDDLNSEGEAVATTRLRLPLEQQLHRRPSALPPRKRQVTLQELIDQLKLIAVQLQLSQTKSHQTTTRRRLGSQSGTQQTPVQSPLELAHQENLTEVAQELEQFLHRDSYPVLPRKHDWLNLEELVEVWTHTKQVINATSPNDQQALCPVEHLLSSQRHERVSVFWALLLLSAQSKVELSQEEFYQEIKIRAIFEPSHSATTDNDVKAAVCSF